MEHIGPFGKTWNFITARLPRCARGAAVTRQPEPAHVADGVGPELAPHAVDQDVDRIAAHFLAPAVDAVFQLLAREDGAGPLQQGVQQRELARRELRALALHHDLAGGQVQLHALGADHRMGAPSRRRITARMRASSSRIS
jgi:hypothetical protein